MENIGDYIYLLVLLIAALSAIGRKKKKAENTEEKRTVSMPDFPNLEDVIPETKMERNPQTLVIKNAVPSVPAKQNISKTVSTKNTAKAKPYESLKNKEAKIAEANERPTNVIENVSFYNAEDARRAFIASEVFNRKY